LQIPAHYIESLGLKDRVRLDLEADHIGVWPDLQGSPEPRERREPVLLQETAMPIEPTRTERAPDDDTRWQRPGAKN
jgi:hypothetical protein